MPYRHRNGILNFFFELSRLQRYDGQYFFCKLDAHFHVTFKLLKSKLLKSKLYKLKEIGCAQYFIE